MLGHDCLHPWCLTSDHDNMGLSYSCQHQQIPSQEPGVVSKDTGEKRSKDCGQGTEGRQWLKAWKIKPLRQVLRNWIFFLERGQVGQIDDWITIFKWPRSSYEGSGTQLLSNPNPVEKTCLSCDWKSTAWWVSSRRKNRGWEQLSSPPVTVSTKHTCLYEA